MKSLILTTVLVSVISSMAMATMDHGGGSVGSDGNNFKTLNCSGRVNQLAFEKMISLDNNGSGELNVFDHIGTIGIGLNAQIVANRIVNVAVLDLDTGARAESYQNDEVQVKSATVALSDKDKFIGVICSLKK